MGPGVTIALRAGRGLGNSTTCKDRQAGAGTSSATLPAAACELLVCGGVLAWLGASLQPAAPGWVARPVVFISQEQSSTVVVVVYPRQQLPAIHTHPRTRACPVRWKPARTTWATWVVCMFLKSPSPSCRNPPSPPPTLEQTSCSCVLCSYRIRNPALPAYAVPYLLWVTFESLVTRRPNEVVPFVSAARWRHSADLQSAW